MTAWRKPQHRAGLAAQGRQSSPVAPSPAPKKPVRIEGDAHLWVTLQKITDPQSGWVKTTRAMQTPAGVLINTCSRKQGTALVAEALALVPGVTLKNTTDAGVVLMRG